ncbi:unnamed protein product [Symbiodinium sp. CCMP2592]|nr:unnamed protein product [Symbiodinium sp. CCMP2592]
MPRPDSDSDQSPHSLPDISHCARQSYCACAGTNYSHSTAHEFASLHHATSNRFHYIFLGNAVCRLWNALLFYDLPASLSAMCSVHTDSSSYALHTFALHQCHACHHILSLSACFGLQKHSSALSGLYPMGKEQRIRRQSQRPGQTNRAETISEPIDADGTEPARDSGTHQCLDSDEEAASHSAHASDSAAPSSTSPSATRLTDEEVRLLRFVQWNTSKPPPVTIFLRPYLRELRQGPKEDPLGREPLPRRRPIALDATNEEIFSNCPGAHGLHYFLTPEDGWWCSICATEHPKGTGFYGCRKCDYDTCRTCATAPASDQKPSATTAPSEDNTGGGALDQTPLQARITLPPKAKKRPAPISDLDTAEAAKTATRKPSRPASSSAPSPAPTPAVEFMHEVITVDDPTHTGPPQVPAKDSKPEPSNQTSLAPGDLIASLLTQDQPDGPDSTAALGQTCSNTAADTSLSQSSTASPKPMLTDPGQDPPLLSGPDEPSKSRPRPKTSTTQKKQKRSMLKTKTKVAGAKSKSTSKLRKSTETTDATAVEYANYNLEPHELDHSRRPRRVGFWLTAGQNAIDSSPASKAAGSTDRASTKGAYTGACSACSALPFAQLPICYSLPLLRLVNFVDTHSGSGHGPSLPSQQAAIATDTTLRAFVSLSPWQVFGHFPSSLCNRTCSQAPLLPVIVPVCHTSRQCRLSCSDPPPVAQARTHSILVPALPQLPCSQWHQQSGRPAMLLARHHLARNLQASSQPLTTTDYEATQTILRLSMTYALLGTLIQMLSMPEQELIKRIPPLIKMARADRHLLAQSTCLDAEALMQPTASRSPLRSLIVIWVGRIFVSFRRCLWPLCFGMLHRTYLGHHQAARSHPPGDETGSIAFFRALSSIPETRYQKMSSTAHLCALPLMPSDFEPRLRWHICPGKFFYKHLRRPVPFLHRLYRPDRIRYQFWNCGGLTASRFQEIRRWIATHPPTILVLTETFWKDHSEWSEPGKGGGLSFIHTGSGKARSAGILVIIPHTIASPQNIRHETIVAGRLLRVRLEAEPSLDILCVYQHTWALLKCDREARSTADPTADALVAEYLPARTNPPRRIGVPICTLIDYAFMRTAQADTLSKQAYPAHTAIASQPGLTQLFRDQAPLPVDRTDTQWPAQIQQLWQLRSAIGRIASHCGLTLSVDLSRAFDTLPESILHQALVAAAVPADLTNCILELHRQVKFCLRDHQISVLAGRGIRQGCPLAPQLWTLASGFIIQLIQQQTSADLVTDGLSLYADDHLCSWVIKTVADLRRGLREASRILDTLSSCELEVSAEKSIFLLELRGPKAQQVMSDITCKLPTGQGVIAGRWKLPLRKSHPYLGIMLSYRRIEHESYQHRKEKAIGTFARLAHVLKDRRALSDPMRIRLWRSLVWPVLSYGLVCAGLTPDLIQDCTSLVAKQLRTITRSHNYYTRETNEEIFVKTGIPTPAKCFAEDIVREISTVEENLPSMTFAEPPSFLSQSFPATEPKQMSPEEFAPPGGETSEGAKRSQPGEGWTKWAELRRMHSLLQSVCRLLLRHEDSLNLQSLDTRYIIFCTNQPDGMPNRLWKVAKAWKELRDKGQATMALRQALAHALFSEVKNRITKAMQDDGQREQAAQRGWITEDCKGWNYLQWDNKEQKHVINQENEPILHAEAVRLLDRLLFLFAQPGVLHRFHAKRSLLETGDAPVIVFVMDIGLRIQLAHETFDTMHRLSQSAITQTVGMNLRQDRLQRSPLANYIQSQLASTSSSCSGLAHARIQDWTAPHRQHDAAEFLQYMHSRSLFPQPDVYWQTRVEIDRHTCVEEEGNSPVICLSLSAAATHDTQSLINDWHTQAGTRALNGRTELVVIQLARYRDDCSKRDDHVAHQPRLAIPTFTDDHTTSTHLLYFRLQAICIHLGMQVTSGHYQAILYDHLSGQSFLTDDNVPASLIANVSEIEQFYRSNYLLFYVIDDRTVA